MSGKWNKVLGQIVKDLSILGHLADKLAVAAHCIKVEGVDY